ncbi:MAG: hypothetical protein Q8881_04060, partial [Sweet potato little leaf phytoplasma]|nr:hypothetical protein [Sweet potato little leaf phytoplasma]
YLILLLFNEFDVILGMDLLSAYRARVDCYMKEVVFDPLGQGRVLFCGNRKIVPTCLISLITVFHLIRDGYEAYLAHVIDNMVISKKVQNIPVVSEFPDVFPEELLGLPPDKETEFTIELVPGTAPISIPPYRMAPTELIELKKQLQELLDKGYIRASISPWGAPVLFVKKKDGTMQMCIDYRKLN